MALPKFFEFFEPFLRAISDDALHTPGEVREFIAKDMNLSEEDMSVMLPSGKITCFYSRYSSGAIKYAENLPGIKVVLINGDTLTKLMIKPELFTGT